MKSSLRTQTKSLILFITLLVLIYSPSFFYSCATGSGSVSFCEQVADISRTAALLLCQALNTPDSVSSKSPTNTLHFYRRVVAGDTLSFLCRISKSGGCIISWHSQHHPDGAVLIEPSLKLAESDSLPR